MAIRDKITHTTHLSYFEGQIPISYRYTYGLAGEAFFQKFKLGKLIASVESDTGMVYCPPRIFCEDTFEAIDQIVELDGTGTVESYTVVFEDMHGEEQAPVVIAYVVFDGADGGFAAPLDVNPEEAVIGMDVQLKFVKKADRQGCINDVYFVPIK